MKQFNQTFLLGGVLMGAAWLPSVATAKPFPKRGYILEDKKTADIGRRASTINAQRAALRMMARMMRWAPKEEGYQVKWTTLDNKGEEQQDGASFDVYEDQLPQNPGDEKPSLTTTGNVIYWPVSQSIVRRVARYNGSFRDLTRYGAVGENVSIDLGVRKSYDAGSRATLRVLAKRLRSPFSSSYSINWSYPLEDKSLNYVLVTYDPSFTENGFRVTSDPFPDGEFLNLSVTKKDIIRVGRRSGNFDDLSKFDSAKKESG